MGEELNKHINEKDPCPEHERIYREVIDSYERQDIVAHANDMGIKIRDRETLENILATFQRRDTCECYWYAIESGLDQAIENGSAIQQ